MAGTVCSSGWLSDAAEDEDALSGEEAGSLVSGSAWEEPSSCCTTDEEVLLVPPLPSPAR